MTRLKHYDDLRVTHISAAGHLSVLITGASTGVGNHLAKYLSRKGHIVYGAVRKDSDIEKLEKIKNVIPIKLDVTKPRQIQRALELITQKGHGLYGLVNNAGIGGLGLFSTWTDKELFEIFNVNVFGPHRITNAFMNLIIQSKGRIVNIGSQGGIITSKYFGPYTMTKHALEAYTVSLNQELRPYGVWVSIVQPGGIISNVGANSLPGIIRRFKRAKPPFKEEAKQILASLNQPVQSNEEDESETNRKPSSPEVVSIAVYDALFSLKPKLRYLVGTKWEGDRVINALIEKLLDENDNPRHNYSRDKLVALLDKHILGDSH